jgi:hypothetical protein
MLSCSCLSINQAAATPPTPVDRYRDDLACASMAVALKNDPGVAKADPAPDPAELNTLVDKTHAITSGRALSKSPGQVNADIDSGAIPYLETLGNARSAGTIKAVEGRLGKSLIACAFEQLGHSVKDRKA